MLDFNDIPKEQPQGALRDEVKQALLSRLDSVLERILPGGRVHGQRFVVGNIQGDPGESLSVTLDGESAGLWLDFATGEGGDIFDLVAATHSLDAKNDFTQVLEIAQNLLGQAPKKVRRQKQNLDDLGPVTAKYDYFDAQGKLIACVYRYDPPGRKKEFRPYDVATGKHKAPEPRPLFNQPGMLQAETVILVEGEKCALALIEAGYPATTAMHGAKAPVNKTDWSPLAGKDVLIWPDRDRPGFGYAETASQAVLGAGASSCNILLPPDERPDGWDAADAIDEGFDVQAFVASGPRMTVHPVSDGDHVPDDPDNSDNTVWGTEDALAVNFTRRYHSDWRYVANWGKWLMWDGQRWRTEETLAATDLIRHVCRHAAIQAESPKVATKLAASSTVGGVERLARTDRRHAATADEWDADSWIINTPGGVVDLSTGDMRPHDRSDRMTKIAAATVDKQATCPAWMQFLRQVTGNDDAIIAYLQRMFGYCMTGATSEHALFFLYGTGANGKSVFVNTLFTLMGDYAANAPMDTFMESRGDRHPTDLAGLRGARFVGATETEQGRRWNESKIKEITGGDRVSARFMRQDFFTFVPQFKLVIAGNHKPAIRNIDEAMKRRLHLIPFTITVPPEKRDRQLPNKLLAEANGIFTWGVQGCLEWQSQGLNPPQSIIDATDEYFEAEDALGQWMTERCYISSAARSATSELFADWKDWAEKHGEFVGSVKRFSETLISRRFARWRNSKGAMGFQGISLQPKEYPDDSRYPD